MTKEAPNGTVKVDAAGGGRRHSPWPLIAVIAVPVLSAAFRLPLLVTLLLLVGGVVLLVLGPRLWTKQRTDAKVAWLQLMSSYGKLQTLHAALRKSPSDPAMRERFLKLKEGCLAIVNSRPDADWGANSGYAAKVRADVESMTESPAPVDGSPETPRGKEIEQLVDLQKKQGLISDSELTAFAEKIKVVAAEKACGMVDTIAGLQLRCRQGEMTEPDFHAALRDLLDKVIRSEADAKAKTVAQA